MTSPLIRAIVRLLLLPTFVIAAAVLVKGYSSVGDGFSAGVIAAVGVLLQFVAFGRRETERRLPFLRLMPVWALAGLLTVLLVMLGPLLAGQALLTHFPPAGAKVIHLGTLELHSAVLFDMGVFWLVFSFAVWTIHLIVRVVEQDTI